MNNFSNKFCENVIYILSSIFREDHLILFNFQLAIMYQRGLPPSDPDCFNELEWKFFLNQRIDNLNKADCFGDHVYEHKWINILEKLIHYYNLSDDILAPILNKYQIDIYGQQSESNTPNMSQDDIDSKSKSNSFQDTKRSGGQGTQTSKVMSKFKNLINKDKSGQPTPSSTNIKGDHLKHNSHDLSTSNDHGTSTFKIQINPAIGVSSSPDSRNHQQSIVSKDNKEQEKIPVNSLNIAYDTHNQNMIASLGLKVREEKFHKSSIKRKSFLQSSPKLYEDEQSRQSSQVDINFGTTVRKLQTSTQTSFVPQLRELSQQKQIQFGTTAYKSFYSILPFLGESSKLRLVVNSISDHSKEWVNYINSSVKIQKRNEEKIQLFRDYPNNMLAKINSQQALLVSKYFRPDCLLRFVQYYIRKCFKSKQN